MSSFQWEFGHSIVTIDVVANSQFFAAKTTHLAACDLGAEYDDDDVDTLDEIIFILEPFCIFQAELATIDWRRWYGDSCSLI